MTERTVLISGAGVGGPTAAYWPARHGFQVTVVERAGTPRSSGNPVDVRGPAVRVAERMGVMPRLREAATGTTGLTFVDAAGRRVGRMDMRAFQQPDEVEVPRGDPVRGEPRPRRIHLRRLHRDAAAHHSDRNRPGHPPSALMVPATRGGILARNLATRLWPAVAAATRLRRAVTKR